MKRTIEFIGGDEDKSVKVLIKFNSKNLTKDESETKFNRIVDNIFKALMESFYYNNIRRLK